jgi:hypothetical protein
MFSFLKPKPAPEGPVHFEVAVEVDRPAADLYALLDWAGPNNAKRQLGHRIEPIDGEPQRYRLVMKEMPDHRFDMTMIEAVPDRSYAFSTNIQPRVGRLESDEEHYSLEPLGEDRCKLKLVTIAEFQRGLSMKQYERELAMMTLACQRALIKLKLHAEQGLDALRALEAQIG